MKTTRDRVIQFIVVLVIQGIFLGVLQSFLPGLSITSFWSALGAALGYSIAQAVSWFIFIRFLSWLPGIFYPVFTIFLSGGLVFVVENLLPGITIDSWVTGLWIVVWMTTANVIFGEILSLDEDYIFDRRVTHRVVKRLAQAEPTDVPGFLFLEIDGLGEEKLRRAIDDGYMPTLKKMLDRESHKITSWETDFTSQTSAMQAGILLGNNYGIPAYRWWDRDKKTLIVSGHARDALKMEKKLSTGRGLLTQGGAARGSMFSGEATESLITMSTTLDRTRKRGPGFYFYLLSPYVIARLISRFFIEVIKEWRDSWQQRRRNDPYRVKARTPMYAFFRGFMNPIMHDLVTYMVITDMFRGLPAVYALYAGYDDISHFAGIHSPESMGALHQIDRYFARIERALQNAPRPYHIVVLSDHGQTLGLTFENAHGVSLEDLVDALIEGKGDVYVAQKTHETWDKLGALLNESIQDESRTANFVRGMLGNRWKDDDVNVGPQVDNEEARSKKVVVVSSGCAGLIYFTQADERMTIEQINQEYPDLLVGLINHPGIGFVLVNSQENGSMVISRKGIHYLDDGTVEGEDPLLNYGPNAARHLKRQTSFATCPDVLVNTSYDQKTQEMSSFEDQVSHHGGLGGPQNEPFIFHPVELSTGEELIVTAESLHRVFLGWREQAQGLLEE